MKLVIILILISYFVYFIEIILGRQLLSNNWLMLLYWFLEIHILFYPICILIVIL